MSSPTSILQSKGIKRAEIFRLLPVWQHVYIWPFFMFVYPALAWWLSNEHMQDYRFVVCLFGGALQALTFLACQWSIGIRVRFTCRRVAKVQDATNISVIPREHNGRGALCQLVKLNDTAVYFHFQKKKFTWNADKQMFCKIDYPVRGEYQDLQESGGLRGQAIAKAQQKYGTNTFDIPLPTFQELFKEHAVAPFFVFQLFCVSLWFMDEYWYYSLFTLGMLFVFESTVVHQRLRNLRELRSMAQSPYNVMVYRDQHWLELTSDQLLPGDLVSIVRGKSDDITVPCDVLLIEGSCIVNEAMLSGESTPLMKEAPQLSGAPIDFDIKSDQFKLNIVFGGTKILQATIPADSVYAIKAPDGGAIGYVLRTGFGTTQGKLVRTMVYSTERVSANNMESLLFICFLLIFAIGAAAYVWKTGIESGRKTSKLLLDCVLIITSVVPPELPMELSLAVNQSLLALSKMAIFCTEPFRIPFAGKVEVCCFDKTGTLTTEKLVLEGVAGLRGVDSYKLRKASELPPLTILNVVACHSLMLLDGQVIGDPMEKEVVDSIEWTMSKPNTIVPKTSSNGKMHVQVVKRFPFSSSLKRMATLSSVSVTDRFYDVTNLKDRESVPSLSTGVSDSHSSGKFLVAVKGAPEVLRIMYKDLPAHFDSTYKHFAMNGSRVLALGYKWLPLNSLPKHPKGRTEQIRELDRSEVEKDLIFGGFLVFHCPLKADTQAAIQELHESMHRIIMITGDNALTACHVAKSLAMVRRPVLICDLRQNDDLSFQSIDELTEIPISKAQLNGTTASKDVNAMFRNHDLCMTGQAMDILQGTPFYEKVLLPRIFVYARVSPSQKEYVLLALKNAGYCTLMCGDGTNDVGALKQAHVGVALLDGTPEDLQKIANAMRERRMKEFKKKQDEMYKSWGIQNPNAPKPETQVAATNPRQRAAQQQQEKMMSKMAESMQDMEEMPVLKFGDASVAAPFTSKLTTVNSICSIIRQGRCTLVTTIQMYKILALNCLITAFSLSALYLDGIKYGDTQVTLQGFLLAGCFLFLSWGKPIQKLSRKRPQPNIFNFYILLSVLGQFAIHSFSLWYVVRETKLLLPADWKPEKEEAKFAPNLLNTAVYLISLSMQVSTFLINYQGRPFRESLQENKPLYYSLLSLLAVAILGAAQVSSELNAKVELVDLTPKFSEFLVKTILFDLACSLAVEWVTNRYFSDSKPPKSLGLADEEWENLKYAPIGKIKNAESLVIKPAKY